MKTGIQASQHYGYLKALVVLSLVYLLGIHWWFSAPMWALGRERAALLAYEQTLQTELRQRDALQASLFQWQQRNPGLESWLAGDAGSVAARLGQDLDAWLAASSVRCQSLARTPGSEQRSGRFRKTALQVRLRCSMQGLVSLLERIEAENPALRVENMEISTRRHLAAVGDQNSGLDVTLDIVAYSRLAPGAK